jgi:hypothetical protein
VQKIKSYRVSPLNQPGPTIRVDADDAETARQVGRCRLEKMGVDRSDPLVVDLPKGEEPA